MTTTTNAATSWGGDAIRPLPLTRAQKTEARSKAEQTRLDAMPTQVRAWSDTLDPAALDVMNIVAKDYAAEGMCPVRLHLSDLARKTGCTERDAADALERCIKAGAVERTKRIAAAPVFRPCARAADSVTVTTAKNERSTFVPAAPGASMGLRRRD